MKNIFTMLNLTKEDVNCLEKVELNEEEKKSIYSHVLSQGKGSLAEHAVSKGGIFMKKHLIKKAAAAVLIAVLLGGTAVYAAVNWNNGLLQIMHADEEEKDILTESNMLSYVNQSVTKDGITITADQCIVGAYGIDISFKVTGFDFNEEEYQAPEIENFDLFCDGEKMNVHDYDEYGDKNFCYGNFHNGIDYSGSPDYVFWNKPISYTEDGSPIIIDETPDEKSNFYYAYKSEFPNLKHIKYKPRYVRKDGSLCYWISQKGCIKDFYSGGDKKIMVKLHGFGVIDKKNHEYMPVITDTMTFEWTISSEVPTETICVDKSIEDLGFDISEVVLSPLDIAITYKENEEYKDGEKKYKVNIPDSNGTFIPYSPHLIGVRFKDSTTYINHDMRTSLTNYTLWMYSTDDTYQMMRPEDKDYYEEIYATQKVIDIKEVESLIFSTSTFASDEETIVYVPIR